MLTLVLLLLSNRVVRESCISYKAKLTVQLDDAVLELDLQVFFFDETQSLILVSLRYLESTEHQLRIDTLSHTFANFLEKRPKRNPA